MWNSLWNAGNPPLQWGIVIAASLAAAIADLKWRRVPNRLTGPVFLGGLAWSAAAGGSAGLADSAVAGMMLALPYVLLFLWAGGGAGDAKLMAALGAWLGLINGLCALACISVAGIIWAIIFALARKRLQSVALSVSGTLFQWLGGLHVTEPTNPAAGNLKLPYAAAVFVGSIVAATGVLLWRHYH